MIATELGIRLWAILAVGSLFFLPGHTLSLLLPISDMDKQQRMIMSIGLSMALIPVLLIFATVAGLRLGPGPLLALLAICGIVSLAKAQPGEKLRSLFQWLPQPAIQARKRDQEPHPPTHFPSTESGLGESLSGPSPKISAKGASPFWPTFSNHTPFILLLLVFAVALGVRWYMVRDLSVPMWGDSYHHTIVSQLIAQQGMVPSNWEPYIPTSQTFTYHFGFQALAAFFHWLSGANIQQSVIEAGQILNALAALTVFPLAEKITGSRPAALVSALLVGLLSPMPVFYTNWGRYTQLAGQVILPIALLLFMRAVESRNWRSWALAGIALGGLILTHYLVLVFYGAFLLAYLVVRVLGHRSGKILWDTLIRMSLVVVGALVLTAPWLWNVLVNYVPLFLRPKVAFSSDYIGAYYAFGDATFFVPFPLLILAFLGVLWALWLRKGPILLLALWAVILLVVASGYRTGITVFALTNYFSVLMMMYIPASILAAFFLIRLMEFLRSLHHRAPFLLGACLTLTALVGTLNMTSVLEGRFSLVEKPDEAAMAWIREKTPPEAKFLVNSMRPTGERGVVVGSDAGWWIPLLTGRRNSVPPINYITERVSESFLRETEDLATVELSQGTVSGALATLDRYGITHIYLGVKGGNLSRQRLETVPALRLLYDRDGVRIFAVNRLEERPI